MRTAPESDTESNAAWTRVARESYHERTSPWSHNIESLCLNWTQTLYQPIEEGWQVAILPQSPGRPGQLVVAPLGWFLHPPRSVVEGRSGVDFRLLWSRDLGTAEIRDIEVADLDGDGSVEVVLVGGLECDVGSCSNKSLLLVGSIVESVLWPEYVSDEEWDTIGCIAIADVDNDAKDDLIFASWSLVQTNRISASPLIIHSTLLPIVQKAAQ